MEFVNSINIKDESCESFSDSSSAAIVKQELSRDDAVGSPRSVTINDSSIKGLLGKGKSRVVFNITLNMARAQIILMNEDETKLATLSQDNLVTDIKVFSTLSILIHPLEFLFLLNSPVQVYKPYCFSGVPILF